MKSKHIIAWIAALFFLTSYFLPAFDTAVGYECALACIQHGGHPYFQAFVFTNVLFVGLVLGVFWMQRFGLVRWVLSLVLLLHTFSWLCFYAWPDLQRHTIDNLRQFHIGYYFWLLAYALLFWAHGLKGPAPNQVTGTNTSGPRQLPMRTRWAAARRSVLSLPAIHVMSTRTQQFCRTLLRMALVALPFCLVGAGYCWWRLGMLWTPDELPGIQFRLRLWLGLVGFIVALAASTFVMLRRASHENVG